MVFDILNGIISAEPNVDVVAKHEVVDELIPVTKHVLEGKLVTRTRESLLHACVQEDEIKLASRFCSWSIQWN